MPDALLPDLPPALEQIVRRTYADPTLARRALFAPWPGLGFRSAYDDRDLWRSGRPLTAAEAERQHLFERILSTPQESLKSAGQPFFPAPGTGGNLRSPYPELSDADFWVFVVLWGSEQDARRELEEPMPVLGGKTSLQVLARRQGLWGRLTGGGDARQRVLLIHERQLTGTYT